MSSTPSLSDDYTVVALLDFDYPKILAYTKGGDDEYWNLIPCKDYVAEVIFY